LRQLKETTRRLQAARTNRRNLIRTGAIAAGAGALGIPPLATSAAPGPTVQSSGLVLAQGLAADTALVTSLRLPLVGIGESQVAPLLQGDIANWHEVGSPIPLPVTLIAVDGLVPSGSSPAEMVADYDALAEKLDQTPGGLAMLPLDMIDPRVNTLEIDGVNPLIATATDSEPVIKLGVAGDIIFGRNGGNKQRAYGDYDFPMYQVKDFLATFDVTVANFECFVSETIEPPEINEPFTLDFVTPPDSLQGMVMAGIDAVTMANNHAVYSGAGYGLPGMNDTIKYLTEAGITPWGVGQDLDEARAPWVTEVNGLSIAFYGVDGVTANVDFPGSWSVETDSAATASRGGTNPLVMDNILADIERLAGEHDIVLPYFHCGEQYIWTPREWIVDMSRECIDAGASAVLTSHPHATMGMEIYKGKPIFYSIGNFVYDQMFSVETRQGYFVDMTFRGKNCVGFKLHGVEIMDFVQPRFMSSREHAAFNDRFWRSVDLTRKEYGYDAATTRKA
jgi:poly-gamma-glutamate synthesis protein (capsule biosynthesis protein)